MDIRLTPLPTQYSNQETMAAIEYLKQNMSTVLMPFDFLSQTINKGTTVPPSPWINTWSLQSYFLQPVIEDTGSNIVPVKVIVGAYSFLPIINLSNDSEFKFLLATRVSNTDEWITNGNREWWTGGVYPTPSDDHELYKVYENDEGTEKYLVVYPNQKNMFVRLYYSNSKLLYMFTSIMEPELPYTNMSAKDYVSETTIDLFQDPRRLIYSL